MTRVMVVDDHTIFRQGIVSLLNSVEGYEVIAESGSGAGAVDMAKDLQPDVIVMDVSMPDMDGIEASRRMKAARIDAEIILLTMHKGDELLEMALDSGIKGYILKEDAFSDLLYAIKAILRGEKFISNSLRKAERPTVPFLPSSLTRREAEIVTLIAKGMSSKEIAKGLFISVKTVETHRVNIMEKLELKNLAELVRYAVRTGLVKP